VLELGSGTGICGLAMAMLGAKVILSDTPDLIELITQNVKRNEQHLEGSIEQIVSLDWSNEHTTMKFISDQHNSCLDFIIAADAIFHERAIIPLVATLKKLLVLNPDVLILMCHKFRHDDLDNKMFEAFISNGFECTEEIFQPEQHPDFSSERICVYHIRRNKENN